MNVGDVLDVEAVVVRTQCRIRLVLRRILQASDLVRRKSAAVERVDLARLERLNARRAVDDDLARHAREADVGCVTPVVVLHEVDLGVVLPLGELERTVGDDVLRLRPLVAELLHRRLVHGEERVMGGLLDEPRLRRRQLDDQREVVRRGDADLVREGIAVLLARVVLLRAFDAVELIRVVRGQLGRQRPLPRIDEVARGDGIAVRPLAVLPQVERHGHAVGADIPALRQARHGFKRVRVQPDQRIHDVQKHVRRRRVGRKTWIERRRLSAPTDRHRLIGGWPFAAATARATARLFVTATATSGDERECAEQTDDEQKQSLSCHVCPPLGYVPGRAGSRRAANQMLRRTCAAES